jgi:hypothetical protein
MKHIKNISIRTTKTRPFVKIISFMASGKKIPQDCAGFWFVYKAHLPVHIWICAGACNAVEGPKDKIAVELFFSTGLKVHFTAWF